FLKSGPSCGGYDNKHDKGDQHRSIVVEDGQQDPKDVDAEQELHPADFDLGQAVSEVGSLVPEQVVADLRKAQQVEVQQLQEERDDFVRNMGRHIIPTDLPSVQLDDRRQLQQDDRTQGQQQDQRRLFSFPGLRSRRPSEDQGSSLYVNVRQRIADIERKMFGRSSRASTEQAPGENNLQPEQLQSIAAVVAAEPVRNYKESCQPASSEAAIAGGGKNKDAALKMQQERTQQQGCYNGGPHAAQEKQGCEGLALQNSRNVDSAIVQPDESTGAAANLLYPVQLPIRKISSVNSVASTLPEQNMVPGGASSLSQELGCCSSLLPSPDMSPGPASPVGGSPSLMEEEEEDTQELIPRGFQGSSSTKPTGPGQFENLLPPCEPAERQLTQEHTPLFVMQINDQVARNEIDGGHEEATVKEKRTSSLLFPSSRSRPADHDPAAIPRPASPFGDCHQEEVDTVMDVDDGALTAADMELMGLDSFLVRAPATKNKDGRREDEEVDPEKFLPWKRMAAQGQGRRGVSPENKITRPTPKPPRQEQQGFLPLVRTEAVLVPAIDIESDSHIGS
ncbi:unnamed protein product, partial [Amoebophrya sp. A120]